MDSSLSSSSSAQSDGQRAENLSPSSERSLVEFYNASGSSCGYCRRKDQPRGEQFTGSIYRMIAKSLRPDDYQDLLDRQWRRSGDFCYNPINSKTCCPNYTIKCDTLKFKFTRSKRKCIDNVNLFLLNGTKEADATEIKGDARVYDRQAMVDYGKCNKFKSLDDDAELANEKSGGTFRDENLQKRKTFEDLKASSKRRDRRFVRNCQRKVNLYNLNLEDVFRNAQEKAKRKRIEKNCEQKIASLENFLYPVKPSLTFKANRAGNRRSLENLPASFKPRHQLKVCMLPVDSKECKALRQEEFELIRRYQAEVHKEDDWTMERFCDFLVETPLIRMKLTGFNYEEIDTDHSDEQNSPDHELNDYLLFKPPSLPRTYGTYHCVYLLDGKLIAVGVLDVLPRCITTVYFFYDPHYNFLNLGIYSAMIEISMIRQMASCQVPISTKEKIDKFRYYYLGFYVHVCKKMQYKTRFRPAYLLCPETFKYVPIEECLVQLLDKKCSRFNCSSSDPKVMEQVLELVGDLFGIPIHIDKLEELKFLVDYILWTRSKSLDFTLRDNIINYYISPYARLVGHQLLPKLVLQLNRIHNIVLERLADKTCDRISKSEESSDDSG